MVHSSEAPVATHLMRTYKWEDLVGKSSKNLPLWCAAKQSIKLLQRVLQAQAMASAKQHLAFLDWKTVHCWSTLIKRSRLLMGFIFFKLCSPTLSILHIAIFCNWECSCSKIYYEKNITCTHITAVTEVTEFKEMLVNEL